MKKQSRALSLTLLASLPIFGLLWALSGALIGQNRLELYIIDGKTQEVLQAQIKTEAGHFLTDPAGQLNLNLKGQKTLSLTVDVTNYPAYQTHLSLSPWPFKQQALISLHQDKPSSAQNTILENSLKLSNLSTDIPEVIHNSPDLSTSEKAATSTPAQVPLPTATIPPLSKITLIDALTQAPLADALVQIENKSFRTGLDGQILWPQSLTPQMLSIHHPAYRPLSTTRVLTTDLQIALKPAQLLARVYGEAGSKPLSYTQIFSPANYAQPRASVSFPLRQVHKLSFLHPGYQKGHLQIDWQDQGLNLAAKGLDYQVCSNPPPEIDYCYEVFLEKQAIKAIYVPFVFLAQADTIESYFDFVEATEVNAIIIDVKGDLGQLAWDTEVELADALGIDGPRAGWMSLEAFVQAAKARNIYTIARMVMFKDNPLALNYPELAVTYADGRVWLDGEGLGWANPFLESVWHYNIDLAVEVAQFGFDEINLDYIRFPSDGNISAIAYAQENTGETRTTAIRSFISRMDAALSPYPVFLSADVFGLTVWVEPEEGMNIGQRVIDIDPYVDYLAPMIYPSTFIPGNLGLADPSADPYTVIYRSQMAAMARVKPLTLVRPWLQGYWYSSTEMLLQKQAANDAGSAGWMWWNSAGVYDASVFESAASELLADQE